MAIEFNTCLANYNPSDVINIRREALRGDVLGDVKKAGINTGKMTAEQANDFAEACLPCLIRAYPASSDGKYKGGTAAAFENNAAYAVAEIRAQELAQSYLDQGIVSHENYLQQFAGMLLGRVQIISEKLDKEQRDARKGVAR